MKRRYVFPELFQVSGGSFIKDGRPRMALRWLLSDTIGLPKALFHVWHFGGFADFKPTEHRLEPSEVGRILTWVGGEAAVAVKIAVSLTSGIITLRAHSAANGAGHIVDVQSVTGPVTNFIVTIKGNPVNSITMLGSATINSVSVLKMSDFVNNPGWKLIEIVGLPVSRPLFDASGYPLDPQGPVGSLNDPIEAAMHRVKEGTPDSGWPLTTDLGNSVPPFEPPASELLVKQEIQPLLKGMNQVFMSTTNPSEQAETTVDIKSAAPQSIHGVDAPTEWQDRARPSQMRPLGSILVAAGSDPYAALALGFGTTVDTKKQFASISMAAAAKRSGIFMVTVEHDDKLKIERPFPAEIAFEGELAAIYLDTESVFPQTPAGVTARAKLPAGASSISSAQPHLDPPGSIDGPWLQTVQIGWNLPIPHTASDSRSGSYVVARGTPGSSMDIRNERRLSGGWVVTTPAISPEKTSNFIMRYMDYGVPEPFPGDGEDLVYSVIAQDLFGRWSSWASANYHLLKVAPPVPAMRKIDINLTDTISPLMSATASVEFTWDWTHRQPGSITIRLITHLPPTVPTIVSGSLFSVGGGISPDLIIDFSSATIDSPPPGIDLIEEESLGNLRTYKVEVNGFSLAFGSHHTIRVTAMAMAKDRIPSAATGRDSGWSNAVNTDINSPIPPPPPTVPVGMQWASVPDPRGISRTELKWSGSAHMYAVYTADETGIRRELNLPSADLEEPATDRLIMLRSTDFSQARRAFRREADRLTVGKYRIELPRGSQMIHFYAVSPISITGVEGPLPELTNNYIAIAVPGVKKPEQPIILARANEESIHLKIRIAETRAETGSISIYRALRRGQEVSIETMGPPVASLNDLGALRGDGYVEWEFMDTVPNSAWKPVFYRVIAYGKTFADRGIYGGESLPSRAVVVVPQSPEPPDISVLNVDVVAGFPDHLLVSFASSAPLVHTTLGSHNFAIRAIQPNGQFITMERNAHELKLFTARPEPGEHESVFRFDPSDPKNGLTMAWVPSSSVLVIGEVTDPAGRKSQESHEIS